MDNRSSDGKLHLCPKCKCRFVQPFCCITCGAEQLYDTTVHSQAETIVVLRKLLRECLEAWEGTGPAIVLDRIRAVVDERPV